MTSTSNPTTPDSSDGDGDGGEDVTRGSQDTQSVSSDDLAFRTPYLGTNRPNVAESVVGGLASRAMEIDCILNGGGIDTLLSRTQAMMDDIVQNNGARAVHDWNESAFRTAVYFMLGEMCANSDGRYVVRQEANVVDNNKYSSALYVDIEIIDTTTGNTALIELKHLPIQAIDTRVMEGHPGYTIGERNLTFKHRDVLYDFVAGIPRVDERVEV